ncbi:hypothetical protein CK203_006264 [Vitis vinifera]|uniref:Endonuclease/exonuclease/phosphatase domain-containing protein n=1 Tax=Vitis vinifera TaxID=29760 RepID=A0A438K5K3_VITVI|nr:hypothetical protein CK203_006264 [Vitis vinifera]
MRNTAKGGDGAGFKGFVGCSHSGSSFTDHLSYPATREKGLNFEGYCGMTEVEIFELARLNLLSESFNYDKTKPSSPHGAPILGTVSQGDTEFSQMAKEQNCHRHLSYVGVVYGPNSPLTRKDFWVELLDLFGLTFPSWCVGGDFNVIRRRSEKLVALDSLLA